MNNYFETETIYQSEFTSKSLKEQKSYMRKFILTLVFSIKNYRKIIYLSYFHNVTVANVLSK